MYFSLHKISSCPFHRAPYYGTLASLLLIDIKERGLYKELTQLCIRMTAEVGPNQITLLNIVYCIFLPCRMQICTVQCVWSKLHMDFSVHNLPCHANMPSTSFWQATDMAEQHRCVFYTESQEYTSTFDPNSIYLVVVQG